MTKQLFSGLETYFDYRENIERVSIFSKQKYDAKITRKFCFQLRQLDVWGGVQVSQISLIYRNVLHFMLLQKVHTRAKRAIIFTTYKISVSKTDTYHH